MTPAKRSPMPPMPKQDPKAKAFFESIVPTDHPGVTVRPMFGNTSAFVNGNMFMGVFGTDLLFRLPDGERSEIESEGGRPFEPMPGRAMKEYVALPPSVVGKPSALAKWIDEARAHAETLPAKKKTPATKKTATKKKTSR